jgi:hypothetical protein
MKQVKRNARVQIGAGDCEETRDTESERAAEITRCEGRRRDIDAELERLGKRAAEVEARRSELAAAAAAGDEEAGADLGRQARAEVARQEEFRSIIDGRLAELNAEQQSAERAARFAELQQMARKRLELAREIETHTEALFAAIDGHYRLSCEMHQLAQRHGFHQVNHVLLIRRQSLEIYLGRQLYGRQLNFRLAMVVNPSVAASLLADERGILKPLLSDEHGEPARPAA